MNNKVCIVTGSSRGLGKGIAIQFAREGAAAVAVTYASNRLGAEETAAEVEEAGAKALVHRLEVTDRESIKKCYEAVLAEAGKIDVLDEQRGHQQTGAHARCYRGRLG